MYFNMDVFVTAARGCQKIFSYLKNQLYEINGNNLSLILSKQNIYADESLIDNLEDNFGYTNELSREEIESFQEHDNAQDIVVPQTEENTETAGQDRSPDSISEESVPIVSSRGRVIRRPGRPMDDEFTWE